VTGLENGWPSQGPEGRARVGTALGALAIEHHGAGALSKVLALLFPEAVPLMPDAALWFAIDAASRPEAPDAQTASIAAFSPMMDWFTREVDANGDELEELAERASGPPLHAAQVLDRMLWFDSAGYRHFRAKSGAGWWSVSDGERSAIVPAASAPESGGEEPIDLGRSDLPIAWRDAALRALDAG
jgi:hypothetical protein